MAKSAFLSSLKPLNARRLQKSVKATVQNNGRLTFAMDAVNEMKLSEDKSIIILAAENGDLGAVISEKGDPEAFALKKCGAYFYISFRNYLRENGIDYKSRRVVYDITELDEVYNGRTLYKFERRFIEKSDHAADDDAEVDIETETPPDAQERASTPSEPTPMETAASTSPKAQENGQTPNSCDMPVSAVETTSFEQNPTTTEEAHLQ